MGWVVAGVGLDLGDGLGFEGWARTTGWDG